MLYHLLLVLVRITWMRQFYQLLTTLCFEWEMRRIIPVISSNLEPCRMHFNVENSLKLWARSQHQCNRLPCICHQSCFRAVLKIWGLQVSFCSWCEPGLDSADVQAKVDRCLAFCMFSCVRAHCNERKSAHACKRWTAECFEEKNGQVHTEQWLVFESICLCTIKEKNLLVPWIIFFLRLNGYACWWGNSQKSFLPPLSVGVYY